MFWIGFIVGIIIGANLSLVLYAMVIAGSRADKHIEYEEKEGNRLE